jgi:hypothetical protein
MQRENVWPLTLAFLWAELQSEVLRFASFEPELRIAGNYVQSVNSCHDGHS